MVKPQGHEPYHGLITVTKFTPGSMFRKGKADTHGETRRETETDRTHRGRDRGTDTFMWMPAESVAS